MGLVQNVIFYLILALGVLIFLKLDKRMLIVNRLFIAVVAVLILLFLFIFISTLIAIVLVVILVAVLLSFLNRGGSYFRRRK